MLLACSRRSVLSDLKQTDIKHTSKSTFRHLQHLMITFYAADHNTQDAKLPYLFGNVAVNLPRLFETTATRHRGIVKIV